MDVRHGLIRRRRISQTVELDTKRIRKLHDKTNIPSRG